MMKKICPYCHTNWEESKYRAGLCANCGAGTPIEKEPDVILREPVFIRDLVVYQCNDWINPSQTFRFYRGNEFIADVVISLREIEKNIPLGERWDEYVLGKLAHEHPELDIQP